MRQLIQEQHGKKHRTFLIEHKRIVGFVVYGRTKSSTSEQIGHKIQSILRNKENIETQYFTENENHIGASIAFYITGVQYGPIGLSKAIPVMHKVANDFKEAFPKTNKPNASDLRE